MIQRYRKEYHLDEPKEELYQTYEYIDRWEQLSDELKSDRLPIQGPEAFQTAILQEEDEAKRKQLYLEKYSNSREFANSFLELRGARNNYAKAKGFSNFYEMMLNERFGLSPQEIDPVLDKLQMACSPWINILETSLKNYTSDSPIPAYNYAYLWTKTLKASFPEFQALDYQHVIGSLENFLHKVGLFSEYRSVYIDDEPRPAKSLPGFIPSESLPGIEISGYVLYDLSLKTIKNMVDIIHEIFHGIHLASMDQRLPYILRKPQVGDEILGEMPPIFSEELIFAILFPDVKSNAFIDQYNYADMLAKMTRWTATIEILRMEKFMYENPQSTIDEVNDQYSLVKKALNPQMADPPPGAYEWANNIYYWLYPVYTLGHLYGGLFAAEVQKAGLDKFGSISSSQFIKWFKKNFLDPGFSQDWQTLYQKAFKKPFNPEYFFTKSEEELNKLTIMKS